jgi:hypothetical protein
MYVKKGIRTNELNYLKGISVEKEYELSATKLADYGYVIVCIHRAPDRKFWSFFKTLQLTTQIAQSKRTKLMCGD